MPSIAFVDKVTPVPTVWLQQVNDFVFSGAIPPPIGGTTIGLVTNTIALLRATSKLLASRVFVLGYYAQGDGGGGQYWYDSTDVASADNGGTIIVAADGGRWKLIWQGFLSVKQFGAKGDGATNDTAAILAAFTVVNAGTGTLYFPAGDYRVTTLPLVWTTNQTANLMGAGQTRTIIRKSNVDANPTVAMSCSVPGAQNIYSTFSEMTIVGSASSPALRITNLARFTLRNLNLSGGTVGFQNLGSLIFNSYDCNYIGNVNGYTSAVSGGIFCNLINFHGGSFNSNTTHGIDLNGANDVHFYGCDLEFNGTAANAATGDVVTQATIGAESGYSLIGFHHTWHESNEGTGFKVNAAAGLSIVLDQTYMILNGGGSDINIGGVDEVTLINAFASGTVNIAAFKSVYVGGQFPGAVNDTSSHTTATQRQVGAVHLPFQVLETGVSILSMDTTGKITATNLTLATAATLLSTSVALTNGAGVGAGTITNAPAAGNPTKWISINDNGTVRKIPAW